jgi:hypothetical protein
MLFWVICDGHRNLFRSDMVRSGSRIIVIYFVPICRITSVARHRNLFRRTWFASVARIIVIYLAQIFCIALAQDRNLFRHMFRVICARYRNQFRRLCSTSVHASS